MRACPRCGRQNSGMNRNCSGCGASLLFGDPSFLAAQVRTSPMAVMSLVFGCLFFLFPAAIVAIVLGHISRGEIARSAGRLKGADIALGGLILGYAGVALAPLIFIFAVLQIPNLIRARIPANEASAVVSLRRITHAAQSYADENKHGYPQTLAALEGLIDARLASGVKNGYVFSYGPTRNCCGAPAEHFNLSADPLREGTTGPRHFFVDETGIIRSSLRGPASAASPPLE